VIYKFVSLDISCNGKEENMKVMTILGTRPEIIRLSLIIKRLDKACSHTLVHTGQNHDYRLNELFFKELGIRKPDCFMGAKAATFGEQVAIIFRETERLIHKHRPDRILILGDTNSGLSAIVAERMGVPVYHMEAGNRCFDLKVPEERNRKVIDSIASYALPYTPGSRENLIVDGIPRHRIMVSGNPMFEVLQAYQSEIDSSDILESLGLKEREYVLVTAHRAENVDAESRLKEILGGLKGVARKLNLPVICSVHPRTSAKLKQHGLKAGDSRIRFMEPFGFFDFVKLEKKAKLVLTDSGTVQEECCLFRVPAVTMRDTTERPETVACGSNMVSKVNAVNIVRCAMHMCSADTAWSFPDGYTVPDVSERVVKFILGEN